MPREPIDPALPVRLLTLRDVKGTRLAAALTALVLAGAACSGSDAGTTTTDAPRVAAAAAPPATAAPTITTTSTTTTTTTTTTLPPTTTTTLPPPSSPLNGVPVDDPATLERRVVAVKIDNHPNARPQSGLLDADAIYELRVESGITRFIALFHAADSGYLGPVRSGRPTDPTLIKPVGDVFQISGAQPWVLSLIRSRGVNIVDEGSTTFRIRGRSAPHNLYTDTQRIRDVADARGYADDPPAGLYQVGAWDPMPTEVAATITLGWASGNTVVWEWDGEHYLRTQQGRVHEWADADGNRSQIAMDVLVVLEGRLYTASGNSGSSVPATDTVGSGTATVFAGGTVKTGTWQRDAIDEAFTLLDDAGEPLPVPPGKPWISVFPSGNTVSWE